MLTFRDGLRIYREARDDALSRAMMDLFIIEFNAPNSRLPDSRLAQFVLDETTDFRVCDECGALEWADSIVFYNDTAFCGDCANRELISCRHCGEIEHVDREIDGLCRHCYENYFFTCDSCGGVFHQDDYADDDICVNCTPAKSPVVYAYHQTTAPNVCGYGPKQDGRFWVGLELEYKHINGRSGAAKTVEEDLLADTEGFAIWAEDSSVDIEMITRPTDRIELVRRLQRIGPLYDRGFRCNSGCGLHINISRSAFVDNEAAARFDFVVNSFSALTVAVSGRDRSDWAALDYLRTMQRSRDAVMGAEGKYRAVRWGADRLEIRCPKSSTLPRVIMARVDYFISLINYANLPEANPEMWEFASYWRSDLVPGFVHLDTAPVSTPTSETLFQFVDGRI